MSNNDYFQQLRGYEPLCGWGWYRWSEANFTQAMFDELGIEVSISGRNLPVVHASNNKTRRKEIMQVVKSYQEG